MTATSPRRYLRDLPVGARFSFVDRHREGDGSGFDDMQDGQVIGKTTEPYVAVKTWNKRRERLLEGGEAGPLLQWPGDRHSLWHELTTVILSEVQA